MANALVSFFFALGRTFFSQTFLKWQCFGIREIIFLSKNKEMLQIICVKLKVKELKLQSELTVKKVPNKSDFSWGFSDYISHTVVMLSVVLNYWIMLFHPKCFEGFSSMNKFINLVLNILIHYERKCKISKMNLSMLIGVLIKFLIKLQSIK